MNAGKQQRQKGAAAVQDFLSGTQNARALAATRRSIPQGGLWVTNAPQLESRRGLKISSLACQSAVL